MRITEAILILSVLPAFVLSAAKQESPEALPKVVEHADPIYPPLARQARIQGDVHVKITTDGELVREAQAESGHSLLRKAAEDNARTWKFVAHTPGVFHVTFRYKLLSDDENVEFLKTPAVIEIQVSPPTAIIQYAWLDLGRWNVQLKSAHGKSRALFEFAYSGPNGDWLDGSVSGPNGESEEIDFGHKEGDFLAFTVTLSQRDGQHVKTFLIGRMTGAKIVGTFVDNAGTTGEWSATRISDSHNPQ